MSFLKEGSFVWIKLLRKKNEKTIFTHASFAAFILCLSNHSRLLGSCPSHNESQSRSHKSKCTHNHSNIFIRIYDTPINNQKGYMVSERSSYHLITIDTVSIENNTMYLRSHLNNIKISGTFNTTEEKWECTRETG